MGILQGWTVCSRRQRSRSYISHITHSDRTAVLTTIITGYPSSPYTLRPFTEPEIDEVAGAERERRKQFNQLLSSIRIRVEHAFGMLKARFPALYSLTPALNIDDTYRHIHAMMVLHNLCIDLDDHPADFLSEKRADDDDSDDTGDDEMDVELPEYGRMPDAPQIEVPEHETEEWLREMGHAMRQNIMDELFPL